MIERGKVYCLTKAKGWNLLFNSFFRHLLCISRSITFDVMNDVENSILPGALSLYLLTSHEVLFQTPYPVVGVCQKARSKKLVK